MGRNIKKDIDDLKSSVDGLKTQVDNLTSSLSQIKELILKVDERNVQMHKSTYNYINMMYKEFHDDFSTIRYRLTNVYYH